MIIILTVTSPESVSNPLKGLDTLSGEVTVTHLLFDTNASTKYYQNMSNCLFVLRFYGPINPMGSCRARSVYLTTRLLGRLSPLSG